MIIDRCLIVSASMRLAGTIPPRAPKALLKVQSGMLQRSAPTFAQHPDSVGIVDTEKTIIIGLQNRTIIGKRRQSPGHWKNPVGYDHRALSCRQMKAKRLTETVGIKMPELINRLTKSGDRIPAAIVGRLINEHHIKVIAQPLQQGHRADIAGYHRHHILCGKPSA
jgi:hypothetical protein